MTKKKTPSVTTRCQVRTAIGQLQCQRTAGHSGACIIPDGPGPLEIPYWLVTYREFEHRVGTTVEVVRSIYTPMHPAQWLNETRERHPETKFSILFAMEVPAELVPDGELR